MTEYARGLQAGQNGLRELYAQIAKIKDEHLDEIEVLTNTICEEEKRSGKLKDQVIWAVTHKDIVNTEGVFEVLEDAIRKFNKRI